MGLIYGCLIVEVWVVGYLNYAFKQAYEALSEEYDSVDKVLKARKHANMTACSVYLDDEK